MSESHQGVAPGRPYERTNGTDGESGCEGGNLSGVNAHASRTPSSLVYAANCRYCAKPIYVAICRDGRWRTFEPDLQSVPLPFAWAWRKRVGMEETDTVRGHLLHFCAEHSHFLADQKVRHPLAQESA